MRTSYFSDIHLKNTTFEAARQAYVEWVVGAGRFDRLRPGRREVGIDTHWPMRDLFEGTSLVGQADARVDTRRQSDRYLLRMVHRDSKRPEILWHNLAELRQTSGGVRISHAVWRTAPSDATLAPLSAAPSVLRRLMEWNGHAIEPRDLGNTSIIQIDEESAEQTVHHLLLDTGRTCPAVLVTPSVSDEVLLDTESLRKRLAGQARVLVCTSHAAAEAVTLSLQQHGFPRQFATHSGALRLFLPKLQSNDSPYRHALWTTSRMLALTNIDHLAGEIAEEAVRNTVPRGFFRSIENFDLDAARVRTDKVISEAQAPSDKKQIDELRADRNRLLEALQAATKEIEGLNRRCDEEETQHLETLDLLKLRERELDELRGSLHKEQSKNAALSAVSTRTVRVAPDEPERLEVLRAIAQPSTPEQCMRALVLLYPESVLVLPSAIGSAKEAGHFRLTHQLWPLLVALATDYVERMQTSPGGDGAAKAVFGSKFAARESDTAMGNERSRSERTFHNGDATYVMWRHLKIGVADNTTDAIRLHFEWLGDEGRVVVGHCGRHLYLPGH